MRKFYGHAYQSHVDEFVDVIKNLYQFYFYCASQPSTSRARSGSEHIPSDTIDMLVDNDDEERENYLLSQVDHTGLN